MMLEKILDLRYFANLFIYQFTSVNIAIIKIVLELFLVLSRLIIIIAIVIIVLFNSI
jgi:hypothetical protein